MSDEMKIATPQHAARVKAAEAKKAEKKKDADSGVRFEWVELVKRYQDEDPKVILKTLMTNGNTHSWYVGRQSKCQAYINDMKKQGKFGRPKELDKE